MPEHDETPERPDAGTSSDDKPAATGRHPDALPLIAIDQFASVELRIGRIVAADPHPNADRLLVMTVDVGEAEPRQIVAGIRSDWSPDELVGRTIVVCCNLKPAKLRGVESQGMMLAVRGESRVWPLSVEGETRPGTRVT